MRSVRSGIWSTSSLSSTHRIGWSIRNDREGSQVVRALPIPDFIRQREHGTVRYSVESREPLPSRPAACIFHQTRASTYRRAPPLQQTISVWGIRSAVRRTGLIPTGPNCRNSTFSSFFSVRSCEVRPCHLDNADDLMYIHTGGRAFTPNFSLRNFNAGPGLGGGGASASDESYGAV